jgi:ribonuclease VapC
LGLKSFITGGCWPPKRRKIAIEPVTEAQARVARQAYRDFGKTSGHPAKLNFGDSFSYALAKSKGEPLLLKGKTSRGRM